MEVILVIIVIIAGIIVTLGRAAKKRNAELSEDTSREVRTRANDSESPWDFAPHDEETATYPENKVHSYDEIAVKQAFKTQMPSDTKVVAKRKTLKEQRYDKVNTEQEEERDESVLKDFDIEKAIIYSEILNPKYKEM